MKKLKLIAVVIIATLLIAAALFAWLSNSTSNRAALSVADFYSGRELTIYVGNPPGGGHDIHGRLLARHLGKHLPGQPTVVVSNMPGAVPNTSTKALANQTLPYVLRLAGAGLKALSADPTFLKGLNTHAGKLTQAGVGDAFDISVVEPASALSGAAPALS